MLSTAVASHGPSSSESFPTLQGARMAGMILSLPWRRTTDHRLFPAAVPGISGVSSAVGPWLQRRSTLSESASMARPTSAGSRVASANMWGPYFSEPVRLNMRCSVWWPHGTTWSGRTTWMCFVTGCTSLDPATGAPCQSSTNRREPSSSSLRNVASSHRWCWASVS